MYLTGATNDKDEPALVARGVGLMVQPGNSYHLRIDRYPYWAADNGCFQPKTYIGDDAWLDWLDQRPRERCLFAVIPDVARRPDGSLGGDPVATWAKFCQLAPVVREMGFPVALAAQDGIEAMGNLAEQIEACDCLFLAGSTDLKVSDKAAHVARLARNAGKWVHMGRVNSIKRMEIARAMGCNSADGTFVKYRRRTRAGEADNAREARGACEIGSWLVWLDENPPMPGFVPTEIPSHPTHREAAIS